MQINSSLSGASALYSMDDRDAKLSASIVSSKDADQSGALSASELSVSAEQIAQYDTDGDGVLSETELAAALKAQREKMQAQMETEMSQSSQLGMLQSSLGGGQAAGGEPPSLDTIISGLFSSDSDSDSASALASASSATSASNAGSSLSDYLEQLDAQMAESIMGLKDADGDGSLSASELGATAGQLSRLDADGDGVLSESELTAGLKSERESMMAENGGVMPPPPPPAEGASGAGATSSTGTTDSASATGSLDTLISGLFASASADSSTDSGGASTLADFLLRQKASNAYQNMDNLIAGLFSSGEGTTQSVSVSA